MSRTMRPVEPDLVTRPLALSLYLAGDPIALGSEVSAAGDLGRALGLEGAAAPPLLPLAPGVVLVPGLAAAAGPLTLRWGRLPHAPVLGPAIGPVDLAIALTGPLSSNRAVLLGIAAEAAILVALILVPPLARVFGLAPLSVAEWAPLLGFPAVMLGLEEGRKWVMRTWWDREPGPRRMEIARAE